MQGPAQYGAHVKSHEKSLGRTLPPGMPPSRAALRRLLQALLRDEADFNAFCVDFFTDIHRRFAGGMDQVARVSLLLGVASPGGVVAALRERFHDDASALNTIDNLLSKPQSEQQQQAQQHWDALERLYKEREQLKQSGKSTDPIDKKIVSLKRSQRQVGQLSEGALLNNRYRLVESIGRGGFANVWKAFDRVTQRQVAIKILHREQGENSQHLDRFERGARQMLRLKHPHIVQVLDGPAEHEDFHYFVMSYVEGGDLFHAVLSKKLDRAASLQALLQIGSALEYAHQQGLVHRDIKPQNILLDAQNQAYLTDFDLVWASDTTGNTRTGFLGTHLYAAPEQAEDAKSADRRADIYSLGMTVLFLLHGSSLPQKALYKRGLFIDELKCSEPVKELLRKATAIETEERLKSVSEFCRPLAAELGLPFPVPAAISPAPFVSVPAKLQSLMLVWALLGLLLLGLGGAGAYLMIARDGHSEEIGKLDPASQLADAAPAMLATGGFTLTSDPPGAKVRLDGVSLGQVTPMRVQSVLAGKHDLELQLGARLWRQQINVEAGETTLVHALPPTPLATYGVSEAGGADAPAQKNAGNQDGKKAPAGQGSGHAKGAKKPVRSRVTEKQKPVAWGYLRINSRPWSKIIIDGIDTGLNTPQTSYGVKAGPHQVTLSNPQFNIRETVRVTVAPGETQTITKIFHP